jgi:hypothetical protein
MSDSPTTSVGDPDTSIAARNSLPLCMAEGFVQSFTKFRLK